jgi:hypothetical protein
MIMLMIVARTMADVMMTPTGTFACAIIPIPLVFVARPVYSIPLIIVVPRSLPSLPGPSGRAGEGSKVFSFMFYEYMVFSMLGPWPQQSEWHVI